MREQCDERVTVPLAWFLLRICAASVLTTGCQFDNRFQDVPLSICVSGEIWTYLDKDSPLMNPGRSCVQCHLEANDPAHAPLYTVAGTVMQDVDEADDCRGASSQTIVLSDAAGTTYELIANTAGNFWLDPTIELTLPYTATIVDRDGNERSKQVPVSDGDCAACHQRASLGGPGRIVPAELP